MTLDGDWTWIAVHNEAEIVVDFCSCRDVLTLVGGEMCGWWTGPETPIHTDDSRTSAVEMFEGNASGGHWRSKL